MADGKLHVLNTAQVGSPAVGQRMLAAKPQIKPVSTIASTSTPVKVTPQIATTKSTPQTSTSTSSTATPSPIILRPSAQIVKPGTTAVVVQGGQVFTPGQLVVQGGGQIVMSSASLAQQLASGKAQLATIGGQQVLFFEVNWLLLNNLL